MCPLSLSSLAVAATRLTGECDPAAFTFASVRHFHARRGMISAHAGSVACCLVSILLLTPVSTTPPHIQYRNFSKAVHSMLNLLPSPHPSRFTCRAELILVYARPALGVRRAVVRRVFNGVAEAALVLTLPTSTIAPHAPHCVAPPAPRHSMLLPSLPRLTEHDNSPPCSRSEHPTHPPHRFGPFMSSTTTHALRALHRLLRPDRMLDGTPGSTSRRECSFTRARS